MKKALSFFVVLWCLASTQVWAYDFSAVAPSGQTLYYNILSNGTGVRVVYPGSSASTLEEKWTGYTKPTGNLIIPSTVSYSGTTYTVNEIGSNALALCDGLTSITIPQFVTNIGLQAFGGCSGLTSVAFNAVNCYCAFYSGGSYIYQFSGCSNITNFTFGDSVKYIPAYLCYGLTGLTSITIGGNVTKIGTGAFGFCSGLTSIIIPPSVTHIGLETFYGCSGLTSVTYNAVSCNWEVSYETGYDEYYIFPFEGCPNITNFTFGNNVTLIPDYLCLGMTGLTSITIPDGVTSIGRYAFYGCSGLTSVTFNADSCTCNYNINGNYFCPFEGCSNITNFTFGNNITIIPSGLCCGLTGLTSITIPNSVTSIGDDAFGGCSGLTSITIPDSVTSIGESAFVGCSGLTGALTIPNSVTSIGGAAFWNCIGLTSVTIGSGVTNIGGGAFYNCTGLTEIHSLSPVAPQLGTYWGYGAFDGVPSSIPVHIPCGSSTSYYSRWSYFSNFVEEEGFTFTATSANEQQGTVQILTMPTCTSPQAVVYATANSGYHFDHWSDGSTSNPYSLTVTDDLDLIGYFVSDSGTEGISDVDADCFRIYSDNGRIVIEGAEGETTYIYDMMGRNVGNADLPAGVYMVKIGNHNARRVVVIR